MQTTTNSEDFNASKVPEMEIESIARAILDIADTVMAWRCPVPISFWTRKTPYTAYAHHLPAV